MPLLSEMCPFMQLCWAKMPPHLLQSSLLSVLCPSRLKSGLKPVQAPNLTRYDNLANFFIVHACVERHDMKDIRKGSWTCLFLLGTQYNSIEV
jgi:hypothetical protein